MASLELIQYIPHRPIVDEKGNVFWEKDNACRVIKNLPLIFWKDGSPWSEVNLWAYWRANSGKTDIKTIQSNFRHLKTFADWLELEDIDWREFPLLERDRVLFRWRKHLIIERDTHGLLLPSTASHRMRAIIQFYRFAKTFSLISKESPLWQERQVAHKFYSSHGLERTMLRITTDLAIPNRVRHGAQLEGGLTPISRDQMQELLAFTEQPENSSRELHLMLQIGFYSGTRIETITDLKRGSLYNAVSDPAAPGLVYLSVGPGSSPPVATKFNVRGRIILPAWLLQELITYSTSTVRLKREVLAHGESKELIFLTRFGRRYADRESNSGTAIGRAMVDLRRKANASGLKFAKHFYFHMTRATFGTWLTTILLEQGHKADSVLAFVGNCMLHKDAATTLKYIKFIENTKVRIQVSNEFTQAFLGLNKKSKK